MSWTATFASDAVLLKIEEYCSPAIIDLIEVTSQSCPVTTGSGKSPVP
ncbi:MAG: hypothetical protein BWY81_00249 [Firmicutes bacterium ADurb.Bin467]|nr:MAG: hypothetical protein BWY81_00249 [Firmicutes bacterium ADurb.Bin467]